MSRKATYHHGNLRAALLEAAFALLVESGNEALTLRGVARRAGVSPGAPYHHFKDKQAILTELANDRRQRASEAFAEAIAGEVAPQAKLRALGVSYVRYALEHQAEFKLMFSGSLPLHTPGGEPGILKLFKKSVQEIDDRLSAAELDTAAIAAWSLAHGLTGLLIDGPLKGLSKDPEGVAKLVEEVMSTLSPNIEG